jgi:hypothetical protein
LECYMNSIDVRKCAAIVVGSCAVFSGSVPAAHAGETDCTGPMSGTFQNVVVPDGASCSLSAAIVSGNVHVKRNAVPAAPAGIRRAAVGPGGQEEGAHAVGERG